MNIIYSTNDIVSEICMSVGIYMLYIFTNP